MFVGIVKHQRRNRDDKEEREKENVITIRNEDVRLIGKERVKGRTSNSRTGNN